MPRISFSTMTTPELNGVEAIKLGRKYGLDGVCLRVSDIKGELTENSTDKEVLELRKVFDSEGIVSSSLFCYNKQAGDDDASWETMKQGIRRLLEIGAILGTEIIRVQPGNPEKMSDPEGFLNRLEDTIAELLENDTSQVSIGFQNHVQMSPKALQTAQLAKKINNPRFGLVFCPTSSYIKGDDMAEVFKGVKSCTKQLYIADGDRGPDGKFADVLPGEGVIPLKEAYQALGGNDYSGWVTLKYEKIWVDTLETHKVSLPAYIKFLRGSLGITI